MRNRPPRQAVLDALAALREPFTIDTLYRKARHLLPGLSRATVYRTVARLLHEGYIRQITPPTGERLFLTPAMAGAALIYCETCGTVQRLEDEDLRRHLSQTMNGLGFQTDQNPVCLSVRCDPSNPHTK